MRNPVSVQDIAVPGDVLPTSAEIVPLGDCDQVWRELSPVGVSLQLAPEPNLVVFELSPVLLFFLLMSLPPLISFHLLPLPSSILFRFSLSLLLFQLSLLLPDLPSPFTDLHQLCLVGRLLLRPLNALIPLRQQIIHRSSKPTSHFLPYESPSCNDCAPEALILQLYCPAV